MSTTKFKPGDLVQITAHILNQEGLVEGDIVEVAESISSIPQEYTSIIMPSGKVLSWLNDRFEIVTEPDAEVAEELPPVSRKHFDESKAAGERRRQKLITHVEELQAKLSEKNKVIAQQQAQLQHVRELVNTVKLALY